MNKWKRKLNKLSEVAKIYGCLLAIVGVLLACGVMHYKLWRLKHPTAPMWTYFF